MTTQSLHSIRTPWPIRAARRLSAVFAHPALILGVAALLMYQVSAVLLLSIGRTFRAFALVVFACVTVIAISMVISAVLDGWRRVRKALHTANAPEPVWLANGRTVQSWALGFVLMGLLVFTSGWVMAFQDSRTCHFPPDFSGTRAEWPSEQSAAYEACVAAAVRHEIPLGYMIIFGSFTLAGGLALLTTLARSRARVARALLEVSSLRREISGKRTPRTVAFLDFLASGPAPIERMRWVAGTFLWGALFTAAIFLLSFVLQESTYSYSYERGYEYILLSSEDEWPSPFTRMSEGALAATSFLLMLGLAMAAYAALIARRFRQALRSELGLKGDSVYPVFPSSVLGKNRLGVWAWFGVLVLWAVFPLWGALLSSLASGCASRDCDAELQAALPTLGILTAAFVFGWGLLFAFAIARSGKWIRGRRFRARYQAPLLSIRDLYANGRIGLADYQEAKGKLGNLAEGITPGEASKTAGDLLRWWLPGAVLAFIFLLLGIDLDSRDGIWVLTYGFNVGGWTLFAVGGAALGSLLLFGTALAGNGDTALLQSVVEAEELQERLVHIAHANGERQGRLKPDLQGRKTGAR